MPYRHGPVNRRLPRHCSRSRTESLYSRFGCLTCRAVAKPIGAGRACGGYRRSATPDAHDGFHDQRPQRRSDAAGDLLARGRVFAEAEGMKEARGSEPPAPGPVLVLGANELGADVDDDAAGLGHGQGAPAMAAPQVRAVVEINGLQLAGAAPAQRVEPLLQRPSPRASLKSEKTWEQPGSESRSTASRPASGARQPPSGSSIAPGSRGPVSRCSHKPPCVARAAADWSTAAHRAGQRSHMPGSRRERRLAIFRAPFDPHWLPVARVRDDDAVRGVHARRIPPRAARTAAPVHLTPKAYELLRLLLARRPAAVSKAEIHDRIWPGTFVSEVNLATLVFEIRAAIGDDREGRRATSGRSAASATPFSATSKARRRRRLSADRHPGPGAPALGRPRGRPSRGREPPGAHARGGGLDRPRLGLAPPRAADGRRARGMRLEDLGSRHGTFVDGERIREPIEAPRRRTDRARQGSRWCCACSIRSRPIPRTSDGSDLTASSRASASPRRCSRPRNRRSRRSGRPARPSSGAARRARPRRRPRRGCAWSGVGARARRRPGPPRSRSRRPRRPARRAAKVSWSQLRVASPSAKVSAASLLTGAAGVPAVVDRGGALGLHAVHRDLGAQGADRRSGRRPPASRRRRQSPSRRGAGACSRISSAIVAAPAITAASLVGWPTVEDRARRTRRWRRRDALVVVAADLDELGRRSRASRRSSRGCCRRGTQIVTGAPSSLPPKRGPGRGCRASPRPHRGSNSAGSADIAATRSAP